jgi:hypothetical protein
VSADDSAVSAAELSPLSTALWAANDTAEFPTHCRPVNVAHFSAVDTAVDDTVHSAFVAALCTAFESPIHPAIRPAFHAAFFAAEFSTDGAAYSTADSAA